jgi:hypothetical protein
VLVVTALFGVIGLTASRGQAAGLPACAATHDDSFVTVTADGRAALKYRFSGSAPKAYVAELSTPSGVQVLRDSPHDHKHHHALMLALGADGVDFWSDGSEFGVQRHVALTPATVATQPDSRRVQFTHDLQWVGPGTKGTLMTERRTIEAVWARGLPATLATWRSVLKPAAGKTDVELWGAHYFGLGVRFVTSMDATGKFLTDSGQLGDVVRGDERLGRAKWCAYTGPADGKTVTLALFDHPDNARHPATMFTMCKPFTYISATLDLSRQKLKMGAEGLTLRYGIALWDGEPKADEIKRVYRRWIELERR